MDRRIPKRALLGTVVLLSTRMSVATTQEIADLHPARLTFGQSVVHQLSFQTYRDPFDELQTRPYNLLFTNIGRHPNLSPWQGQEGNYSRYLNALIGNNGVANVDNDADAIQGSWIQRQTDSIAWGVSAALLSGTNEATDANGTAAFSDVDNLQALDLRGAVAWQVSERSVLGGGLRVNNATSEITDESFEPGVGGFLGAEQFDQMGVLADAGIRQFLTDKSSWEVQGTLGYGTAQENDYSEDRDGAGTVTDRFVIRNYDLSDVTLGVSGGYNQLHAEGPGEVEYRMGLFRTQRQLDNTDLAYTESGGTVTPDSTLLDQQALATTQVVLSAKTLFAAGETELFLGGQLAYGMTEGSTTVDDAGTIVTEGYDGTVMDLGGLVGLRQSLFRDKLRFIVSCRANMIDGSQGSDFGTTSTQNDATRSVVQYAIGLEGVLANVTFDIAWLTGDEAPVDPVALGIPSGSRRTVNLDRLVFSAAVSW